MTMRRPWRGYGWVLLTAAAVAILLPAAPTFAAAAPEDLLPKACDAMARATGFFTSIATNGGWAGIYSADLKDRWGESTHEKCGPDEIWVQPPGTPTVGGVLLWAYRATGEKRYLAAARNAGRALVWGQRTVGGWDHRVNVAHLAPGAAAPARLKGHCTFDDDITQGAIDFLMDLDRTLDEPWLDDGVRLGLAFLLKSQFPNGAWPQWYPLRGGYQDYYTFNDNTINDCIRVLLDAHRQYGWPEVLAGAKRGGDFVVASRLPEPQSGWAQQYSHDMKPAWARAFEPPAVCSAVTSRNIQTLVDLAVYTKDAKYLEPIPLALAWLGRSKLKAGLWARFYEVGTNKPIYGDRDGKVHYTLEEISEERRSGYSWQSSYGIEGAAAYYRKVKEAGLEATAEKDAADRARQPSAASLASRARSLAPRVEKSIAALDAQGRWLDSDGRIRTATFVGHMRTLCDLLEAAQPR